MTFGKLIDVIAKWRSRCIWASLQALKLEAQLVIMNLPHLENNPLVTLWYFLITTHPLFIIPISVWVLGELWRWSRWL